MKSAGKTYTLSIIIIAIYIGIALLSPFIAGDDAILCRYNGKVIFPFWNKKAIGLLPTPESSCIMPLIPYTSAEKKYGLSPFAYENTAGIGPRHWLGTDKLGRDVAAAMVRGCAVALKIGFLSVLFAFLVGVSLGMVAGYYRDNGIGINKMRLIFHILGFLLLGYMFWMEFVVFEKKWLLFIICMLLSINIIDALWRLISRNTNTRYIHLPIDTITIKAIEIRKSFPGVFLLLALISLFKIPSVWNIVIIISLLSWADFARLARGDTLVIKNENYITSAKVLGFADKYIIFRHILPNILPTLIVSVCFSVGSAIILESTLSFLGVGLPVDEISWGKLLAEGRNMRYWWLVVFPGMAIFILILCLNNISNYWQNARFSILERP